MRRQDSMLRLHWLLLVEPERKRRSEAVAVSSPGTRFWRVVPLAVILLLLTLRLPGPAKAAAWRCASPPNAEPGATAGYEVRPQSGAASPNSLVVLADHGDPYYALAQEIAAAEGVEIVESLEEALALDPEFLLWVVSPSLLSDQALVDSSLALAAGECVVSVGIISGSTMEQARQLWERGSEVEGRLVVAANAANPSGHIRSSILVFGPGGAAGRALTKANLARYLERADYLTFTGHGGRRYLRLDEETTLGPSDIPDLSPLVVATASCNTFRIWEEESIALALVDSGAAAYAGFAYSPNEGYLLGEFFGVPLRYTWPGFSVGHAVQLQSRGTVKGFASFPYYYLLGDPRIALQTTPPYHQVEDREEGDSRFLSYSGAPSGFIPLRIPGGARYEFVEISGVTSSWEGDPFYNARLQMGDLGDDKLLLFEHSGGEFSVALRERVPWPRVVSDLLSDSLDHTLLYLAQTGGDLVALFSGLLAWLSIMRVARRSPRAKSRLLASVAAGVVLAALHGAYVWARLDDVTITSKHVELSLPSLLGTLLLTGAGAFVFLSARSWRGKGLGLVIGTLSTWAAACFSLALVAAVNWLVFRPELGRGAYNYVLGVLPAGALVVQGCVLAVCFCVLRAVTTRAEQRRRKLSVHPGS